VTPSKQAGRPFTYLIVINNLSFFYSHFWNLAIAIRKTGWTVIIAANQDISASRLEDNGMTFISLPPVAGIGGARRLFPYFLALFRELRHVRPTIVHFIYLETVLLGGIASRLARVPAVVGAITGLGTLFAEDRLHYKIARFLVMAGIRLGFGSHHSVLAFENLDDRGYFVDRKLIQERRTAIIPGAGVPSYELPPPREANKKPVVLFASRMIKSKGVLELVRASEEIHKKGVDFELWLVGAIDSTNPTSLGPDEISGFSQLNFVKYLGYRTDVKRLMQDADVFCLPTYYREGLPRVIIEACAAGKPIITTDVPGCREIVHNYVNGLIVPPRDHDSLVHSLEILLADKDLRLSLGRAARQVFDDRYTLDAFLRAFDHCYRLLGVPLVLFIEERGRAVNTEDLSA
jgi:glycosyltransferase involved in cell wall biosynthesis